MISLSPEAKEVYAKYVGPDGRLIIDESVPENLRETFQFFNDHNINILNMNIEDNIPFDDEEPDSDDSYDDEVESDDVSNFDDDEESDIGDFFSDL